MAHSWTPIFKTWSTSIQDVFWSNHISNHFECIIHSEAQIPKVTYISPYIPQSPISQYCYLDSQTLLHSRFLCFEIFHLFFLSGVFYFPSFKHFWCLLQWLWSSILYNTLLFILNCMCPCFSRNAFQWRTYPNIATSFWATR